MAIVKMKRLRLLAVRSDADALLRELSTLGCVEVTEPEIDEAELRFFIGRDEESLAAARQDLSLVGSALNVLEKYVPVKRGLLEPKPRISSAEALDETELGAGLELAREIEELEAGIRRLYAEESRQRTVIESLEPWKALNLPLNRMRTATCSVTLGTLPASCDFAAVAAELAETAPESELFLINSDRQQEYAELVCHRSAEDAAMRTLREHGFSVYVPEQHEGTVADAAREASAKLDELGNARRQKAERITSLCSERDALRLCYDRLCVKLSRCEAAERLENTETSCYLEGWLSAPDEAKLSEVLSRYDCAWELSEPTAEEYGSVPVQLKNGPVTKPLNMVTDMYSLPAYGTVDPNPLMAPFFIIFYGFMMADMGYGLIMMLISLIVMKKVKPTGQVTRYMFPLMGLCGVTTFIVGAMTGSFFGDLIPRVIQVFNPASTFALPALFSPMDDAITVLLASLAIGLIQIFTGMGVNMYKQIKRGEVMSALCAEGAWFLVFICAGVYFLTKSTAFIIAIPIILVLTQGYGKKGVLGVLAGIGGSLYNNITGYFSDILSYSRLMALMLAGAVIAQVFNTLGALIDVGIPVVNLLLLFIISMIGNALNFALNLLGCFVHDMRLQCLEFFGRFYEDGGRPFRPLNINTQYNVIKD